MKRDRGTTSRLHGKGFVVTAVLFLICLGAALYGYLIKPPALPENPVNIMLPNSGGPVLFTHKQHYDENEEAIDCELCHHNFDPEEQPPSEMNCRVCHYNDAEVAEEICIDDETHPRCIGMQCNECHDGEECSFCHRESP